jgi:hypothetical protein
LAGLVSNLIAFSLLIVNSGSRFESSVWRILYYPVQSHRGHISALKIVGHAFVDYAVNGFPTFDQSKSYAVGPFQYCANS